MAALKGKVAEIQRPVKQKWPPCVGISSQLLAGEKVIIVPVRTRGKLCVFPKTTRRPGLARGNVLMGKGSSVLEGICVVPRKGDWGKPNSEGFRGL